ncbi:fumarate hydratase, class I [Bradyrhizobium sp. Ghvi]|nr:fumarate hydratase, class I [Bradyrhizobium sp. Ghvi]
MKVRTAVRPDARVSNSVKDALSLLEKTNYDRPIAEDDIIRSVADALQYNSYYHPPDYIRHLNYAYEAERSLSAKDAIAQILVNSRMSALGKRPLCQDTGLVSS